MREIALCFALLIPLLVGYQPTTEYIEVEKIVEIPVDRIVEVSVEKIVEVPVEVIVKVSREIDEFPSLEVLEQWLADDDLDTRIVLRAGADGKIHFNGACDYTAMELQRRALADGYLMSTEIIEKGKKLHMICSAVIGNDIYFIEPGTDEVWLGAYRN